MEPGGKEREPGPGAYGVPDFSRFKRAYPSWKIGTSKRTDSQRNLADAVPGPGAYKPKTDVNNAASIDFVSSHWNTRRQREFKTIQRLCSRAWTVRPQCQESPQRDFVPLHNRKPSKIKGNARALASSRPGQLQCGGQSSQAARTQVRQGAEIRFNRPALAQSSWTWSLQRTRSSSQCPVRTQNKVVFAGYGSFGAGGRGEYQSKAVASVPGPGAYHIMDRLGREGSKFSIAGRPKADIGESTKVPGPAAYNASPIERKGGHKFGSSGDANTGSSTLIGRDASPGPGQYDVRTRYKNFKHCSPAWKYCLVRSVGWARRRGRS